ncbi:MULTISPECIES: hypothetical protein [unclassified Cytobacillus]|nr:hypothetical protein [Cytobacillus sp. AMY 15.2]MCM3094494.1 hypothetical protein [Cytobacillus sp. AMY 15.2]
MKDIVKNSLKVFVFSKWDAAAALFLIEQTGQHSCNEGKWSLNKKITSW